MLFNFDFANNTILLCFFFFFLVIDFHFLIAAVIAQIFDPISELVIPIGIPNKAKAKTRQCPIIKNFTFYSSINFDLFVQLDNFLFHLYINS